MRHYGLHTLGPKGEGEPYDSFCVANGPAQTLHEGVKRWIEEYGSIDKEMLFVILNEERLKVWKYKIIPVRCGRYKTKRLTKRG